jgi:hypothetical protein
MEVGMGVPREPIRLLGDAAAPRSRAGPVTRAHERVRAAARGVYLRPHPKELMLNHV